MSRTDVQLLQDALIWTSSYSALKDGVWGQIAATALQQWRRANNLGPSDMLGDDEKRLLLAQAARERGLVGWTTIRDARTGVWIGYPGRVVQPQPPRPADAGTPVTSLRGADRSVAMSLFGPGLDLAGLRALLAEMAQGPDVEQVSYRLDRADRQVLSTEMKDDTVCYTRFDRDGDAWRGFVIRVSHARSDLGRLISAASADFSASSRPVGEDAPSTPQAPPRYLPERLPEVNVPPPRP